MRSIFNMKMRLKCCWKIFLFMEVLKQRFMTKNNKKTLILIVWLLVWPSKGTHFNKDADFMVHSSAPDYDSGAIMTWPHHLKEKNIYFDRLKTILAVSLQCRNEELTNFGHECRIQQLNKAFYYSAIEGQKSKNTWKRKHQNTEHGKRTKLNKTHIICLIWMKKCYYFGWDYMDSSLFGLLFSNDDSTMIS